VVALRFEEHLDERRRLALEERPARDGELAAHDPHPLADRADGELAAIGLRGADAAGEHGLAHPVRDRRLAIVGPHERFAALRSVAEAELHGERLLELRREQVLMAVGEQVHAVADAEQEVDGVLEVRDLVSERRCRRSRSRIVRTPEAHLRHPHRGVQVAETALPVLQLRLEQVDRVARLLMALLALGDLLLHEVRLVRRPDVLAHLRVELREDGLVAAEVARVEDRRLRLRSRAAQRADSRTFRIACPTWRPASQSG
jgi:hypothetical protein